jgi:hypothetical protein
VSVQQLPDGRGRGLVAVEDIAADEVILSVPLTRVFMSDPVSWCSSMASAARLR